MPIDLPYSFLVKDGDFAWSCGQLALDSQSQIMAAGDLVAQSEIVCDYIEKILKRADLDPSALRRLLLYYIDQNDGDRDAMLKVFESRFGHAVLLNPIPVPHYYYEGVELEVDAFCHSGLSQFRRVDNNGCQIRIVGEEALWISLEADTANLDEIFARVTEAVGRGFSCLSEHWFVPEGLLVESQPMVDKGAIVSSGPKSDKVRAHFTFHLSTEPVDEEIVTKGDVTIVFRQSGRFAWLQGRSINGGLGLVEQTKAIMKTFEALLPNKGLSFADVVKSTTHYVGGSAEELHSNMQVRNAYYSKPGPASTGLPVFGFGDQNSKVVVDLTFAKTQ